MQCIYDRKRTYLRKKVQIWWVKNDTAAYRKSEIEVFLEKLRSESPQMLKSHKLHVSVYLSYVPTFRRLHRHIRFLLFIYYSMLLDATRCSSMLLDATKVRVIIVGRTFGRLAPAMLKKAWSANFKLVFLNVLLRSLRPELDGQMSFNFMESSLPTIITRTLDATKKGRHFSNMVQLCFFFCSVRLIKGARNGRCRNAPWPKNWLKRSIRIQLARRSPGRCAHPTTVP
jgi:hypothetical protein